MEAELRALEQKLHQFIELCQRMRLANEQLRQELASARDENRRLAEKINAASSRLEELLAKIPEEET